MLAYHIMGSANPEHTLRLLKWIYSPKQIYLITVDNLPALEKFKRNWLPLTNVNCALTPPITWGGVSIVSSMLSAIGQLIQWGGNWEYFIPLSDSDVPLKCQDHICASLERETKAGKSLFMHLNQQRGFGSCCEMLDYSAPFEYKKRLEIRADVKFIVHEQLASHFLEVTESPIYMTSKRLQFHVTDSRRNKTLYIRPLEQAEASFRKHVFDKYTPRFGKFWCILNRKACNWLMQWEDLPLLFTAFSSTFIPDESFIHTAFGGEHFPWHREVETSNHFRWQNGTADVISDEKLSALRESDCFFARKVRPEQSARLFEWIESWSVDQRA